MTKRQPLVSVIMPVFNAEEYLVQAIESIRKQTYPRIELIMVNDNSTDKSAKIMTRYAKRYPKMIRVIHLTHTLNRGGDACANEALKRARGKYIARMDADDVAHPERIGKQVAFLEENKEIFLVGSNAYVINRKGKKIGEKNEPLTHEDIKDAYLTFHPIIHPTAMYRRLLRNGEVFTYPKKYTANNDYYIFFKLLCEGYRYANLKDKLLYYRIHGKNDTFSNIKEKFFNTMRIRFTMVFYHNYSPTHKQILINIAQTAAILLLPSSAIRYIYFVTKGIVKIKFPTFKLKFFPKFKLSFKAFSHA